MDERSINAALTSMSKSATTPVKVLEGLSGRAREMVESRDMEIANLRATLRHALRQWRMYAEMVENNDGFNLATEKSPEADIFRAACLLVGEKPL